MNEEQTKMWLRHIIRELPLHTEPSSKTIEFMNTIIKKLDDLKTLNSKEHVYIIEHQKETNGNVKCNTEFRLKNEELIIGLRETAKDVLQFKGGLNTIKWIAGFIGFSNITIIIYLFVTLITK